MVVGTSGQYFVLYSLLNGYLGPGQNIPVRSLTECTIWCVGTDGCSSFFYSEDDKRCQLASTRHFSSSGLTSTPGYKYYMKVADDPCGPNTCNGHGTCAPDTSNPPAAVCSCDIGYNGINCENSCGADWTYRSGQCYRYIASPKNHQQAESSCEKYGGYLAIGGTKDEHAVMGSMGKGGEGFWVGGTDEDVEGKWVWSNGEAITLDLWNPEEPNGENNENCLEIKGMNGLWNWSDAPCDMSLPYLCEK